MKSKFMIKESETLKTILQYLRYKKGFFWRNNTGGIVAQTKERERFFRFGLKGSADIIGLKPGGQLVAIEVKALGKKQSPSQIEFQKSIESNGGLYVLAYSVDDVIKQGI